MIKSILAATALLGATSGAAFAGPYVNVEANSGFAGSDYNGTTTEAHVGYAGETDGGVSFYVQGGPALVSTDGADSKSAFTGKAGGSVAVSEAASVYGEIPFAAVEDAADTGYATKLGVTWNF